MGTIRSIKEGDYNIDETVAVVDTPNGSSQDLTLLQRWPVRVGRPYKQKLSPDMPLVTGQRVIDTLFPICLLYTSICQRLENISGIDQITAREIQDAHVILHLCNALCIDHFLCIRGKRHMQGDIIAVRIDFIQCLSVLGRAGEAPRRVHAQIRLSLLHI